MPLEDKYNLTSKLGQGQYGEVWSGTPIGKESGDTTNPDQVAVKIFKKICRTAMVENEIQIMSQVGSIKDQNPGSARNIVEVFDTQLLSNNGRKSIVLEFLSGHELFDRIASKGSYSERDAAQTVARLATSLDLLHKNRILHRDLKPENIVYRTDADDADPVIVDFGFGLTADKTTASGCCYYQDPHGRDPLGTHGYIAPESYESCVYMDKSDIWALGVITYTILVGFPPLDSKDKQLSLRTRKGKYYPLTSEPWKDVSDEAKDLVSKMLTVNPEERPSAAQVLEHPWITKWVEREDARNLGDSYMERMSKMRAKQKLKKTINGVVGAIRFKKAAVNVELKRQEAAARAAGDTDPTLVKELSVSHHQIRELSTSLTQSESMKEGSVPTASRQSSVFSATEKETENTGAMFDEATLAKMRGQGLNYQEFCVAVKSVKLDCLANRPVFEIFDESGDELVTITEFLTALATFRNKIVHESTKYGSSHDAYAIGNVESVAEKSKFFFSIFDLDKSGTISRRELYQVIGMLLAESDEENTFRQRHSRRSYHDTEIIGRESVAMPTEEDEDVADYSDTDAYPMSDEIDLEAVFKEIDTDGSGEISLDEFTEWFAKGEADGLFTSILDPMTQTATRMAQMLEGH
jgi:serine/threonine protein kinase/Ca2+-binding EF-hand superfamily protein